jgi:Family of unknown function (DUF6350)
MSSLLDGDVTRTPAGPHEVPPAVVTSSLLAALQAVAASLVAVMVPVVGTWIATANGTAAWTDVVRLGLDLWVLAQHGGIVVVGGHVGIVPLGLSAAPLAACWFSGRRLARALDPRAERIAAGATRAAPSFPPLRALVIFASGYALLTGLAAVLATMPQAQAIPGQAFIGAGTIATVAGGLGAAAYRYGTARAGLRAILRLLPGWARGLLRPAATALGIQLTAALVLFVGVLVAHRDQVLALHRALQPDLAGGAVLVLAQLLLVPNLILWTASVIAGPGFAIGAGTSVTTSSAVLGPLPALPVLGALPTPGPMPVAAAALLCVPVVAGVIVGGMLLRDRDVPWWRLPADAVGVAVLAGAAFAGLAWLSGGPAGPGRLAVAGPVAWQAGAAFAAEVGVGAVGAVLVLRGVPAVGRWALDRWRGGDSSSGRDWAHDWDWDAPDAQD